MDTDPLGELTVEKSRTNRHGRFSLPSLTADVRNRRHRANPSSQRIRIHQIEHHDFASERISGREGGIFHHTLVIERRVRGILSRILPGLLPPSATPRLSQASGVPRRPSWIGGSTRRWRRR